MVTLWRGYRGATWLLALAAAWGSVGRTEDQITQLRENGVEAEQTGRQLLFSGPEQTRRLVEVLGDKAEPVARYRRLPRPRSTSAMPKVGLSTTAARRGQEVWNDDCVEMSIDADHDMTTYHKIVVSAGAFADRLDDGENRHGDRDIWDADLTVSAAIGDDFWSVEVEMPANQLADAELASGALWDFNFGRNRVANGMEYSRWAPTYGFVLRPERFGCLVLG